jgi:Zn-dependent protease/CBS domain-containing protein
MLKDGIPIGRIFGISVRLHYSWFIIFALVIWSLAADYFPAVYPQWGISVAIAAGVITSLLFFASLLAHELMHSLVAQRHGIPVKSITLFLFGGVSQISEEPREARTEFLIAIVGPLMSLFLGGVFWLLWVFLPPQLDILAAISFWLGWINIALAVFNMVPGFPLDGGRVLRAAIWWRTRDLNMATRIASNVGRGVGYLLMAAGAWVGLTGNWSSGLWLALIGWYLAATAAGSYRYTSLQQALEGHSVSEVVSDCVAVPPDLSIERLVDEYIVPTGRRCFIVVREGITVGLVSLQEVKGVLRDMRSRISVSQVMKPLDKLKRVSPADDLSTALNILTQENLNQVPVMVDERMVGMVTREDLAAYLKQNGRKGTR